MEKQDQECPDGKKNPTTPTSSQHLQNLLSFCGQDIRKAPVATPGPGSPAVGSALRHSLPRAQQRG